MNITVLCPSCKNQVEFDIPIECPPKQQWEEFPFVCQQCGKEGILSVSQYTKDASGVNSGNLPTETEARINEMTAPIGPRSIDGKQVFWISNKLGFSRPEKKSLGS